MDPDDPPDWAQAPEEARLYRDAREAGRAFRKALRKVDWFGWLEPKEIHRPRWWAALLPDEPRDLPPEISTVLHALSTGCFGQEHDGIVFGGWPNRRSKHASPVRTDFLPRRLQRKWHDDGDAAHRANLAWMRAIWQMAYPHRLSDTPGERLVELFEWVAILPEPSSEKHIDRLIARIERFASGKFKFHRPVADRLRLSIPYAAGKRDEIRRQVADLFERCDRLGVIHGRHRWELRCHGRLLYRIGERGAALRCLCLLGDKLGDTGWAQQPRFVPRRPALPLTDPMIATHPLMAGAWLEPENLPSLLDVFRQAADAPWVFDRLHAALEWQMILAGRDEVLEWIDLVEW